MDNLVISSISINPDNTSENTSANDTSSSVNPLSSSSLSAEQTTTTINDTPSSSSSSSFSSSISTTVTFHLDTDDRCHVEAVKMAYRNILASIHAASVRLNRVPPPRLVAVSKTKPISMILDVYTEGSRHFGENYVQEIITKANDSQLQHSAPEIKWHFIGTLQSNKAKQLITSVPNLWMVESVDSIKLANLLDKAVASIGRGNNNSSSVDREQSSSTITTVSTSSSSTSSSYRPSDTRLKVLIQVNTSDESQKGGVECGTGEGSTLALHIVNDCPHLSFEGLMTIGKLSDNLEDARQCFQKLVQERNEISKALQVDPYTLELSMGMSNDYEIAMEYGATSVRVGSSIFGARTKKE